MTGKQYLVEWISGGRVVRDEYDDYDRAKDKFDRLNSKKKSDDILKMYSRIVTSWQEVKFKSEE